VREAARFESSFSVFMACSLAFSATGPVEYISNLVETSWQMGQERDLYHWPHDYLPCCKQMGDLRHSVISRAVVVVVNGTRGTAS
jgi:hypothetical protein